jgi:hypothetical protein
MRIKPSNKQHTHSRKEKKTSKSNVHSIARKETLDAQPVDMFDIEVLADTGGDFDYSEVNLVITTLTKELVRAGYSTVEIISDSSKKMNQDKKLSRDQIIEKFKESKSEAAEEIIATVDLKQYISKSEIGNLGKPENLEDPRDHKFETSYRYVKSAKRIPGSEGRKSTPVPHLSTQADKQGILEIRLGKEGKTFSAQATQDVAGKSALFDQKRIIAQQIKNNSIESTDNQFTGLNWASRTSPTQRAAKEAFSPMPLVNPLIALLKGSTAGSTNKRPPSCGKKENISKATAPKTISFSTGRSSRQSTLRKPVQKPFIKAIRQTRVRQVNSIPVKITFPSPGARLFVRLVGDKNKRNILKPVPVKTIPRLSLETTYPFLDDKFIPKIVTSPLGNSQVLVRISNIDEKIDNISVYRREISSSPFTDVYEKIIDQAPISADFVFFDITSDARAYKYICISDNLPIYTYSVFVDQNFSYEKFTEPKMFAYQDGRNVVIKTSSIPAEAKKVLIYRKSSLEGQEQLVDGISLLGRQSSKQSLKILDEPSPLEQIITYRLETVDDSGITSSFDDRPEVVYTSDINSTSAAITVFTAKYNSTTDEVDITGEALVDNMFISKNDAGLKNPDADILKAAARRQLLVKIQIRRIDNKSGEDEIILREVINPGLSKFDTTLASLNRIKFKFSDSGENASTFGYTPLLPFRKYTYIARIIIYPLGLELRKVPDFKKLDGEVEPGRLKYQYNPGVFDHPLNTETGILPGTGGSAKDFMIADTIGQTTRAILRRVAVKEADTGDSVSVKSKIFIDDRFDPVVRVDITVPKDLLDNLDHVELIMSYNTVSGEDVIDRLYLQDSESVYYDYAFDDLAAEEVSYKIKGIGKDLRPIFTSSESRLSLESDLIKSANMRRKSLKTSPRQRQKILDKARRKTKRRLKRRGQG